MFHHGSARAFPTKNGMCLRYRSLFRFNANSTHSSGDYMRWNMEFHIGPITHYFSFLSGLILGWTPAALAYPDLLFSVLTIPLMYVLIAKMFGRNMALVFPTAISGFIVITEINDQEIINRIASGRVSMFQIREYGK